MREPEPPGLWRGSSQPALPHVTIFPVLAELGEEIHAIGTGFFVSPSGIFLTAGHVVREHPLDVLVVPQLPDAGQTHFIPRKLAAAIAHRKTDIAFCIVEPLFYPDTKRPLFTNAVALTSMHPREGERVNCYSFPQTIIAKARDQNVVFLDGQWDKGEILRVFLNGRDRVIQPGICFETSLNIPGGGSGGPVFNSQGQVFGVVSSGITEVGITYVASIVEVLDLPLFEEQDGGSSAKVRSLRDFACVDVPHPLAHQA